MKARREQHLERDFPAVLQVLCQIHPGHAASADLLLYPIAVRDGLTQAFRNDRCHWCNSPRFKWKGTPRTTVNKRLRFQAAPIIRFPGTNGLLNELLAGRWETGEKFPNGAKVSRSIDFERIAVGSMKLNEVLGRRRRFIEPPAVGNRNHLVSLGVEEQLGDFDLGNLVDGIEPAARDPAHRY